MSGKFSDVMLAAADQVGSRLTPLNSLLDGLANRLVPHVAARADLCQPGTVNCYVVCDDSAWQCWITGKKTTHTFYAYSAYLCSIGEYIGSCDSCDIYGWCS
jgi:hypothetical protein